MAGSPIQPMRIPWNARSRARFSSLTYSSNASTNSTLVLLLFKHRQLSSLYRAQRAEEIRQILQVPLLLVLLPTTTKIVAGLCARLEVHMILVGYLHVQTGQNYTDQFEKRKVLYPSSP